MLFLILLVLICVLVILFIIRYLCGGNELIIINPSSKNNINDQITKEFLSSLLELIKLDSFFKYSLASFEITYEEDKPIKFYIRSKSKYIKSIQKIVSIYGNHYSTEIVKSNIIDNINNSKHLIIRNLILKNKFVYPLNYKPNSKGIDSLSYVLGNMNKLKSNDSIAIQILISPNLLNTTSGILKKIKNGNTEKLVTQHSIFFKLVNIIFKLFKLTINIPLILIFGKGFNLRSTKNVNNIVVKEIENKMLEPNFVTDIRVISQSLSKNQNKLINNEATSGIISLTRSEFQSLRISNLTRTYLFIRCWNFLTKYRIPSIKITNPEVLSLSELTKIVHLPDFNHSEFENIEKRLNKTLPIPISYKNKLKEIIIGVSNIDNYTELGLSLEERQRHMYVIGGTGNGKTTFLKYQIVQDIDCDKGLAVVDPHGDLAEEILGYIPKERIKDVVYINPDDLDYPVGINLLEIDKNLTGNDLLREKDLVTESVISVFRKIFSDDDSGGHRIEYVLRNTVQTALTTENPTIFTIFSLLNDPKFRSKVVDNLEDEDLRLFWRQELGKAGDFQRVKMTAGITAKVGRFLFSASARGMLSQTKSTIDFEKIMDEGKILICNLSKGLLGEDASRLFGVTILAKIQLAALKRARKSSADRRDFFLYVDEFQNFATISFVEMLSEARKYRLYLTMAEQSTQQQTESRLVEVILANVGTVVTFRSGSPNDERLILPLFKPYLEEGQIANLPAYNFYVRIASVEPYEPMSATTLLVDRDSSKTIRNEAVSYSKKEYGSKSSETGVNKIKSEQFKTKNKISKNTEIEYGSSI